MLGFLRSFAYDHADRMRNDAYVEADPNSGMPCWDINRISRSGLVEQNPVESAKTIVNRVMRRAI
jgi:hypothetical protein